jgi:hypothetical protein
VGPIAGASATSHSSDVDGEKLIQREIPETPWECQKCIPSSKQFALLFRLVTTRFTSVRSRNRLRHSLQTFPLHLLGRCSVLLFACSSAAVVNRSQWSLTPYGCRKGSSRHGFPSVAVLGTFYCRSRATGASFEADRPRGVAKNEDLSITFQAQSGKRLARATSQMLAWPPVQGSERSRPAAKYVNAVFAPIGSNGSDGQAVALGPVPRVLPSHSALHSALLSLHLYHVTPAYLRAITAEYYFFRMHCCSGSEIPCPASACPS